MKIARKRRKIELTLNFIISEKRINGKCIKSANIFLVFSCEDRSSTPALEFYLPVRFSVWPLFDPCLLVTQKYTQ